MPYRLAIPQPVKRKLIIYIFALFVKLFGNFSPFFQRFSIKAVPYKPFKRLFISFCRLTGSVSGVLNLGNKSKFPLGLKNSLFIRITLRAFSFFFFFAGPLPRSRPCTTRFQALCSTGRLIRWQISLAKFAFLRRFASLKHSLAGWVTRADFMHVARVYATFIQPANGQIFTRLV